MHAHYIYVEYTRIYIGLYEWYSEKVSGPGEGRPTVRKVSKTSRKTPSEEAQLSYLRKN